MAIMGYSGFLKAPALLEPHHQIVSCHIPDTPWVGGGSYPSAEVQSVSSTAPAERNGSVSNWNSIFFLSLYDQWMLRAFF